MITPTFDIEAAREQLKAAREALATCEEAVAITERILAETSEARALAAAKQQRAEAQERCDLADGELRCVALGMYALDGQRKPCEGVEVKLYGGLEYDPSEAETWCREHATTLLRLDKVRFEKAAQVMGAPVKVTETPKVFIAREL